MDNVKSATYEFMSMLRSDPDVPDNHKKTAKRIMKELDTAPTVELTPTQAAMMYCETQEAQNDLLRGSPASAYDRLLGLKGTLEDDVLEMQMNS